MSFPIIANQCLTQCLFGRVTPPITIRGQDLWVTASDNRPKVRKVPTGSLTAATCMVVPISIAAAAG